MPIQTTTTNFKTNWNSKLNCQAFTTFRIHNKNKYQVGKIHKITLDGKFKKFARIEQVIKVKLTNVTNMMAYIDTGYPLKDFIKIVEKMYKGHDISQLEFCFILFVTESQEKQGKLF